MTLLTLLLYILIAAFILMGIQVLVLKIETKNYILSFLQHFVGALFIFSGAVKAIDPLGTAYKMEQYFAQFEMTFAETAFSFLAPIFPLLSSAAVAFSVIMIVFEIVLGVALIIGSKPKRTAWAYFILVIFFTILTGFTFTTGYVPQSANYFAFSEWGAFSEANMRVTDCGCFGDFLKLEPFVSFMKDIFLLIPGFFFIIAAKKSHEWFSKSTRTYAVWGTLVAVTLFCLYNFVYDLPIVDFRPFAEGTDVRTEKERQVRAVADAPIFFIYRNPNDTTETQQFTDTELDKIPEGWEYYDRIQDEIETNKIFDFVNIQGKTIEKTTYLYYDDGSGEMPIELSPEDTLNGMVEEGWVLVNSETSENIADKDVSNDILNNENAHFMIVCNDLKKTNKTAFAEKVAELAKGAEANGMDIYAVVGKAGTEEINEFKKALGVDFPFYETDDILLKTIIRSNPGVVLWNDGKIIKKWHHRHLPDMETIETDFLK